jgi:hypothetical protein
MLFDPIKFNGNFLIIDGKYTVLKYKNLMKHKKFEMSFKINKGSF